MRKILVVLDAQEEAGALMRKAVQLARHQSACLEIFVCCYNRSLVASYLFDIEAKKHAEHGFMHGQERRIEELITRWVPEGVQAFGDVHWDRHQEEGILQKIARYEPDLVIKSCRYHHLLEQTLFGHLEGQLIRHCPRPLLLVKGDEWGTVPCVAAAVDPVHDHEKPESLDSAIIDQGVAFCGLIGGRLRLFHSFQPLPASVIFDDTLVLDYERFKSKLRWQHQEAMARLIADSGLDSQTPTYLAQGEASQALPAFVDEQKVDILVMGAVDRTGVDRLFVGNTAEDTLDRLRCDLLVVKDRSFKPPEVER